MIDRVLEKLVQDLNEQQVKEMDFEFRKMTQPPHQDPSLLAREIDGINHRPFCHPDAMCLQCMRIHPDEKYPSGIGAPNQ